jgi:hypothetical protein
VGRKARILCGLKFMSSGPISHLIKRKWIAAVIGKFLRGDFHPQQV